MNYVGMCFYEAIGNCLCSPFAGSGTNSTVGNATSSAPSSPLSLAATVQMMNRTAVPSVDIFSLGPIHKTSYRSSSQSPAGSAFDLVSSSETTRTWGGGGPSGGAPAPEVDAGLAFVLVAGTVAVLRRRQRKAVDATL
ncbi:hypothetical protein KHHGKMAE_4507 [Methylobacterium persicinum]|nr:hypothetical protein KHHGKMAE_4507 [Methylobacterium persicinum]